jgi:hypothetical protein
MAEELWVLWVYESLLGLERPHAWLVECDVDAGAGLGSVLCTRDPAHARTFLSFQGCMDYWARQSTVCPWRDDGKPNRPLTAFTVSPTRLVDALETAHVG